MENHKSNPISPDDAWMYRKATLKHVVITFAVLAYMFAIVISFKYYSERVSFALFGLLILCSIVAYFITPKENRRIIRDFSNDNTATLLAHVRRIYVLGTYGALCMALLFGMFLGVILGKRTSYPEITDYIVLAVMILLLAALTYGPYLLLVKKLLPQLKKRLQDEKTPNNGVKTDWQ